MEPGNWPREERERDIETGRSVNSSRGQAEGNGGIWFAESLLVVAILLATVAFQARLSPPGGVRGESKETATPPGQAPAPDTTGQSILWHLNVVRYRLFAISNDITLALSLLAIQLLLARNFVNPPPHMSGPVSSKQGSPDWTKQGIPARTDYLQTAAAFSTAVALVSMAFTYVASAVSISSDKVQTISLSVVLVFSVTLSVTFYVFKVKSVRNFCTGTSN